MKKMLQILALVLALMMVLTACAGKTEAPAAAAPAGTEQNAANESAEGAAPETGTKSGETGEFVPKLDTQASVELNVAVFFGNFEAFDQVINHFNAFYPDVTITYEAISGSNEPGFLENNPYLDIFMTSTERGYPTDSCVDLLADGVDFGAVSDGLLESNTVDGKVLALPMGLTLKGIVVNKTLLENEGLTEPQTWPEFLSVLEALKQKGYTPIQDPNSVMGNLIYNMGMVMLSEDSALLTAVQNGDAQGATALQITYDRMQELYDNGYISTEVNAAYPEDNYDGAIMKFFEGDVPFWVCDTEKVSGMKKRESKSEAFSANPFDYEFTFAPMGDNGVYAYLEPWYGFAVNKDSEDCDYAVEFLRFMAREDELNTLASVKGVPSVAKNAPDERYVNLRGIEKIALSAVCDGSVPAYFGTLFSHTANDMLTEETPRVDEAVQTFVSRCAESL